jgi:ferrochelatase
VSPLNEQNRRIMADVEAEFADQGIGLPVYFGNRNWHPLLPHTVAAMKRDGVRRALAFVTSAYGSYSGCRQYVEDIERAREAAGPDAPGIDKIRLFYNHPLFIEANAGQAVAALHRLPAGRRDRARLVFTAHSLPVASAEHAPYQAQLGEACRLVAEAVGREDWILVYQSRSGPPSQPWLEPDVCDFLRQAAKEGVADVVLAPIGLVSDHLEVVYDLDIEARAVCERAGIGMARAGTAGTHLSFVKMIRELVEERLGDGRERRSLGPLGPWPDTCPGDCCPRTK